MSIEKQDIFVLCDKLHCFYITRMIYRAYSPVFKAWEQAFIPILLTLKTLQMA
jgi:hypothetical protein